MRSLIRIPLAVVAGMAAAFVLVVAVEWFSAIVHPFSADFDGNIPEHVRHYPHWVLAIVLPAWSAIAIAATWIASRIGNRYAGAAVALLLGWALTFNLTMLPYTLWFKIAMFIALPVACLVGIWYGKRSARA